MSDDIIARLRCTYRAASEFPCEACTFCVARAEIERLRAVGDKLAEAHIDDLCDCDQPECVTIREAHAAWQEARRGDR